MFSRAASNAPKQPRLSVTPPPTFHAHRRAVSILAGAHSRARARPPRRAVSILAGAHLRARAHPPARCIDSGGSSFTSASTPPPARVKEDARKTNSMAAGIHLTPLIVLVFPPPLLGNSNTRASKRVPGRPIACPLLAAASQRGCPEDQQHGRFWLPRGRSWLPRFKKDARKPNSMAAGAHLRARARPLPWDIHPDGSSFAGGSTPPAVGYPFWRELIYERGHAPCRGVFILAGAHPRARARAPVQCSAFGKYLRFRGLPLWLAIKFYCSLRGRGGSPTV